MRNDSRFFYGWVIVAISFVTLGLGYSVWVGFSIFFPAILQDFGWTRAETVLALSIFNIVHGVSGPLFGFLTLRFGARRLMPVGAVFLGLSIAACSLIQQPWHYYVLFGVFAAMGVNAVGVVPNFSILNRWFVKRRGSVVGITSAGIGAIGILTLVPLSQHFISTLGWRTAYVILGAIIAFGIPPLCLFYRDRPEDLGLLPDGVAKGSEEEQSGLLAGDRAVVDRVWVSQEWTVGRTLRTARFWLLFAAFFLASFATQGVFAHQAAYFMDIGRGQALAAAVIGLVGLASIPAKVGWGFVSDRLGREAAYTMGLGCLAATIALLLSLPQLSGTWPLYLFALLFGFGYAAHPALSPSICGDVFAGRHFPVIYGAMAVAGSFGSGFGPLLAGYVFDLVGSYHPAFLISLGLIGVATVAIWVAAPRKVRLVSGQAVKRANKDGAAELGKG